MQRLPLIILCSLVLFSCNDNEVGGLEGSDPAQCGDNLDNDGDGFVDCADQDCYGVSVCIEGDVAGDCSDGRDNDWDGYTDCDDQDCWGEAGCEEGDADTDTDMDADTDTDSDTDTDADTDAVVFINELLASNNTIIADDGGGYDDWLELYNPGDRPVYLDDFTMSADLSDPEACPLADGLVVPAEGWLLLWADAALDQGDDHLCFSLARGGGEVGLYRPNGAVMDAVVFQEQTSDISYARYPDGADYWRFDSTPSPESAN